MTNANIESTTRSATRLKTTFVLSYYLLTILTGIVILFVHGRLAFATDLLAAASYLAMTILLYGLSQPKPRVADSRKEG